MAQKWLNGYMACYLMHKTVLNYYLNTFSVEDGLRFKKKVVLDCSNDIYDGTDNFCHSIADDDDDDFCHRIADDDDDDGDDDGDDDFCQSRRGPQVTLPDV